MGRGEDPFYGQCTPSPCPLAAGSVQSTPPAALMLIFGFMKYLIAQVFLISSFISLVSLQAIGDLSCVPVQTFH